MPVMLHQWRRDHRTGLRRAVWALAALYALYLLAANVFLNSTLGVQTVNRNPERYHAQWSWAMSLYPGYIYARDIAMGGHARTNVWTMRSPAAHGRIQLTPLLRRELRFGTIRSRDVTLHVERSDVDMPSMPRTRPPWTLQFDAITTDSLRHMTFYAVDVTGTGRASFAVRKQLRGGPMEVLPSRLRMPDARLQVGDVVVLEQGDLDFRIAMPPHLRAQAQGAEKIALTDARLVVSGRAPGLDLGAPDDDALPIAPHGDAGRISADLSLRRGVLVSGGRLDWSAPVLDGGAAHDPPDHRLQVALRVLADGVSVRARIPQRDDRPGRLEADLRIGTRRLDPDDWVAPLRTLSGEVDLRWRFASLRWLNPLLSQQGWLRLDGAADVDAALRLEDGRIATGSRIEVPDATLEAEILDNVFSGSAHARGRVEGEGAAQRTRIDIVADRFALAPHDARNRVYVRGRDLRLDLASSGDLADFHDHLQARLRFEDADIPDLRAYNRYLPKTSVRLLAGTGQVSGDLALDAAGEVGRGHLRLSGREAAISLGTSRLTGNLQLDSRLARIRKTGRRYALEDFSLNLDNVRLDGDDAPPWWMRFSLEEGELDWQQPFEVGGRGRLQMKDVSVLLALFAERSAFPAWIGNIVDAGQTRATGVLRVRDDEVVLDRIVASNDRIELDARLRIADGRPDGDLYARWGVLGLGVELHGGQRKLHIAGAQRWYESRPDLLPAGD